MCVVAAETGAGAETSADEPPPLGATASFTDEPSASNVEHEPIPRPSAQLGDGDEPEEETSTIGEEEDADIEEELLDVDELHRGKTLLADGRLELCQLSKLLQCIRARDVRMIDNLVSKGVPRLIDHAHPDNETVLGLAASRNDDTLLSHLLGLGADPNVADVTGRTAAMRACEYGHLQSMNILAEAGIDVTLVDDEGQGTQ